jgi:hypothetical protein
VIRAVVGTRHNAVVLSHFSAAAVWDFPVIGSWPAQVHVVAQRDSCARSKNGVRIHRTGFRDDEVILQDGLLVTTPERTLLDLARSASFPTAVAAWDFALNARRAPAQVLVTRAELCAQLDGAASPRGKVQARRVLEFARANSDNAGESLSRVVIHELGFPEPLLQTRHLNPRGGYYFADYEWPEFRLIGELDGREKYLKAEYLRGRNPGQVVFEEKVREDHLRAEGNRVARWQMTDVHNRAGLLRVLTDAGLPRVRRPAQPSF